MDISNFSKKNEKYMKIKPYHIFILELEYEC